MRKWIIGVALVIITAAGAWWFSLSREAKDFAADMPDNVDVLFWTQSQRDAGFRAIDQLPILAQTKVIETGDTVYPLPKGTPLSIAGEAESTMKALRMSGLVIVQDGKLRLERYGLGFSSEGRWTSFSVAKSFTSTLVGAAIRDGHIRSLSDKVTAYIPEMKGSAYDDVTIAQLLTMTSGVRWNEDYQDPKSDVALFNKHKAEPGIDSTVSYMRKLPREAPAGSKWVYKTGETNLIGVLVSKATKKSLSQYLSEKIWAPFGMEQDATWLLGSTGHEISGCCVQASTRDFARMGVFLLGGGMINGKPILPDGWVAEATTKKADIGAPGRGYGYQWWTLDDGSYQAQGIFGQGIFIDPKRKLVIASNGNWPKADDEQAGAARMEFYRKVQAAIDAEGQGEKR